MSLLGIDPKVLECTKPWRPALNGEKPWWYRWDGGWYEVDGENTRYCVWDLDENSVVFDIGGYEGAWAFKMATLYNPKIYVFEPALRAFEVLQQKMSKFPKAHLFNYGLGDRSDMLKLSDSKRDSASFLPIDHDDAVLARMVDIADFLDEHDIDHVDLMAVNVEGYEFELLPYMIVRGLVPLVDRFMIQWHNVFEESREVQLAIQNMLAQTHRMIWNHGAWEAWQLRGESNGLATSMASVRHLQENRCCPQDNRES